MERQAPKAVGISTKGEVYAEPILREKKENVDLSSVEARIVTQDCGMKHHQNCSNN